MHGCCVSINQSVRLFHARTGRCDSERPISHRVHGQSATVLDSADLTLKVLRIQSADYYTMNKKLELMLTRRAKAYSSSGSR